MATKKTTKGTSAGRPRKTVSAAKVPAGRKVNVSKPTPTDEEIRKKAEEIYHERIARGEYGTAADDWHKAEALLKGLKAK